MSQEGDFYCNINLHHYNCPKFRGLRKEGTSIILSTNTHRFFTPYLGIDKIMWIDQTRGLYLNPNQNGGQLILTPRLTLTDCHYGRFDTCKLHHCFYFTSTFRKRRLTNGHNDKQSSARNGSYRIYAFRIGLSLWVPIPPFTSFEFGQMVNFFSGAYKVTSFVHINTLGSLFISFYLFTI